MYETAVGIVIHMNVEIMEIKRKNTMQHLAKPSHQVVSNIFEG
jgi:hypothetical protein